MQPNSTAAEEAAAEVINILSVYTQRMMSIWMTTTRRRRSRQCMWWMHFDRFRSHNVFSSPRLSICSQVITKKDCKLQPLILSGRLTDLTGLSLLWSAAQKGHGVDTFATRSPACSKVKFSAGFHFEGFSSSSSSSSCIC